ncbi:unnamed protein product [Durusdinium trenchii]|uniref:Uncharacterized protein n=1 Tax=Durusdinium trenchii TaxID=1381693 RepID=A0ABP0PPK8_9DINO
MATALSGQDPFTMPMSIVIKDHLKYARAVMRSLESRSHFDQGALSERLDSQTNRDRGELGRCRLLLGGISRGKRKTSCKQNASKCHRC